MQNKGKKMAEKITDNRARIWTFVAYPDSVPENWESILTEKYCLKWARSPLHDSDLNADETQKKAHWHIVLIFDGKKSYSQIKEISDSINATIPQIVHNLKGLMRYFVHIDNPEKAQYDIKNIYAVGINAELEILGQVDFNKKLKNEILEIIKGNDITEYCDLCDFLQYDYAEHFEYATNHTVVFSSYLKSRRQKGKGGGGYPRSSA